MDDGVSQLPPRLRWRQQWKEKKRVEELVVPPDQMRPTTEEPLLSAMGDSPTEWSTIVLEVKVPAGKERIPIEMDVNDTVLKLKEKVLEQKDMYAVGLERVVLQYHRKPVELLDEQLLKDFVDSDRREIDVYIMPPRRPPRKVRLKVMVAPMNSKERLEMEVRAEERVAVLRVLLEKAHRIVRFRLPTLGRYVFIHNDKTMDEKMSFRWHRVLHGDTIRTLDRHLVQPNTVDGCLTQDQKDVAEDRS
ncbi:unnamed protein product [Sphenostylis stenocarpa]|uniref:Ubiquitin-like domain-containing protein n=1 Tax=Sphenostylis stenocarpa TaxID=92480 RepID=A0AA86W2Q0_9FABA|nr:unnamed protein product [Sphenostylis stenocarpa]